MSQLAQVLLRFDSQVKKTHDDISKCGHAGYCLLDALIQPPRYINYTPQQEKQLKDWFLHSTTPPQFNTLGIFQQPEIGILLARWEFIRTLVALNWDSVLENPKVKWQHLVEISRLTSTPTILLAIKYFWIIAGLPEDKFICMPSITAPVETASEFLFGCSMKNNLVQAKTMHTKLAIELDKNEMWVNTALWEAGKTLLA